VTCFIFVLFLPLCGFTRLTPFMELQEYCERSSTQVLNNSASPWYAKIGNRSLYPPHPKFSRGVPKNGLNPCRDCLK
jgi:hypothetical protein